MQAYSCTLILRMPPLRLRDTEWGKGTKGTMNKETYVLRKNWGLHCGTAEDRGLLGCDTMSLGARCFVSEDHSAFIYKIKQSKKNHSLWADSPWKWWHYYWVTQPNCHALRTILIPATSTRLLHFCHASNFYKNSKYDNYCSHAALQGLDRENWTPIDLNLWTIKLQVLCNILIGNMLKVSDETKRT